MSAPHCIHLLAAESELPAECHAQRRYLTVRGEILPVSELPSSYCEAGCERAHIYCPDCLHDAARRNADAGLVRSPTRGEADGRRDDR